MNKLNIKNIYIWGTGYRAEKFNESYFSLIRYLDIKGYIDNDSKKWGSCFWGKEIFSPEILRTEEEKNIYILNQYSQEIKAQIDEKFHECNITIIEEDLISRMQVISRYENTDDLEIKQIVDYLLEHPLKVFNYGFIEKYTSDNIIQYDKSKQLFYTYYQGKKMYFSRDLDSVDKVQKYYKSILLEQDEDSPHLYLGKGYEVQENAIVVDAGVAEGNFSLSIIDSAKKIYMFESDKNWCEALSYTFEPYKDKVVIINKYLSNYRSDDTTTIDEEIKDVINYIKIDVEGEELYALKGALNAINKSDDLKCIVCTYHQEFAYEAIKVFFDNLKIKNEASNGYMWYPDQGFRAPVLRRGLIRAKK